MCIVVVGVYIVYMQVSIKYLYDVLMCSKHVNIDMCICEHCVYIGVCGRVVFYVSIS